MDRLACISFPGLRLQVALRRFPPDFNVPLAVVESDKPTSRVLAVNRVARDEAVTPGMRYSEALALAGSLRAVTVADQDLEAARRQIEGVLRRFTPAVEACPADPGCFWVRASGLGALYGSEVQWGKAIRRELADLRFRSVVVIGGSRAGTYVMARTKRRSMAVRSLQLEKNALDEAPVGVFPLLPRQRQLLRRLGLTTVASVLRVPRAELASRFGPELARNLRAWQELETLPLQSVEAEKGLVLRRKVEEGASSQAQLEGLLQEPLQEGLKRLVRKGRLLQELRLALVLESGTVVTEVFRPAEPSVNFRILAKLLGLRLEKCQWAEPVVELRLAFVDVPLPPSSGELFPTGIQRDLRRGAEALALLRARWGDGAVVRAVLEDSHVPDRSFRWVPTDHPLVPRPASERPEQPTAVRRVRLPGVPSKGNPSGQRLSPSCRIKVLGPQPVDKEYWFLRTRKGDVVWVSWDRLQNQACWEGVVD